MSEDDNDVGSQYQEVRSHQRSILGYEGTLVMKPVGYRLKKYNKEKKTDGRKGRPFQLPHIFAFLLSKVGPDLLHALALCHVEGTAGIAVAAADAV